MNTHDLRTVSAGALLCVLGGASALGDAGLPVTITNDNSDAILVTVYDLNGSSRTALFTGQRVNGFASIPVSITVGAEGTGHLKWTAASVDTFARKCGQGDVTGLANNAEVHVSANSDCQ